MIAVDYIRPLSWPRNYIVVLPATALLFGCVFVAWTRMIDARWWRLSAALALALFVVGSTAQTVRSMTLKWAPHQDVKGLLSALYSEDLCNPRCDLIGFGLGGALRRYSASFGSPLAIDDLREEDLSIATDAAPLILWNMPMPLIARGAAARPDRVCRQPDGPSWQNTIVVFLPPEASAQGLVPCAPF
jgi:hypothetical protein